MQTLTFEWMEQPATITLNVDSYDQRSAIKVSPLACQKIVESLCEHEDDGRGTPMGNEAFTAMGIARVLTRVGFVVEGLAAPVAALEWASVEPQPRIITGIDFFEFDNEDFENDYEEEGETTTDNQWNETDPEALAALKLLAALIRWQNDVDEFLNRIEAPINVLDRLGLIEKHETWLRTVTDRSAALINTEMRRSHAGKQAQIRLPVNQDYQDQNITTDNPWNEDNPEALAALKALYELKDEPDIDAYMGKMGTAINILDDLGLVEKHEPWLHTVADHLTDMMIAEGI